MRSLNIQILFFNGDWEDGFYSLWGELGVSWGVRLWPFQSCAGYQEKEEQKGAGTRRSCHMHRRFRTYPDGYFGVRKSMANEWLQKKLATPSTWSHWMWWVRWLSPNGGFSDLIGFTKFAVQGEDGSEETSIVKARAPSVDLHHVRLEVQAIRTWYKMDEVTVNLSHTRKAHLRIKIMKILKYVNIQADNYLESVWSSHSNLPALARLNGSLTDALKILVLSIETL